MLKRLAFILSVCILGVTVTAFGLASTQQVKPATASTPVSVDDALKAVRADLQAGRAEIVAKNVALTAEQAAKFWPAFEKYQTEQNVIMDEQLKNLQKYVDSYETLDDAAALALIQAHLDRDAKMNMLRQRWLDEFRKILPTKLAVRVIQIDRRLSLAYQVEVASRIPLVH